MIAGATTFRFTSKDFERLIETGILGKGDHVELIEGELIVMSPIGIRHAAAVRKLTRLLNRELSAYCFVDCQSPFLLSDHSEPQPDVFLVHLDIDETKRPTPADIFLVVEVADSSLGYDRGTKLALYAREQICEVWIANLIEGVIERYRDPVDGRYRSMQTFTKGESLSAQAFPDVALPVAEMLP